MSENNDFVIEKGVLTAYRGAGGDIVIPDGVTHIKMATFEDNWDITSVALPESMTEVSYWSFGGCKNLKSVRLPDTIRKIGGYAFMNCESLANIHIPENVKEIGDYAFIDCKNLKDITLPKDAEVGCGAFVACEGLADENGMIVLNDILYGYVGESLHIEIPENITAISSFAFSKYDSHVFRKYDRLENLTIKGNVKIGRNAFSENLWIERCTLVPDSTDEDAKQIIEAVGTRILAIPFLKGTLETNPILQDILLKRMILKPNRSKLIPLLIEKGESELLARLLALVPKMPADEIDSYIQKADGMAEASVLLINYKSRLYPPEILDKMEEIQMEKDFGLREKTLADYKKIFTLVKQDGIYLLKKYKGEDPHAIIPGKIKGVPVIIHPNAFTYADHCKRVDIEEGMTEIPKMAFAWCNLLQEIHIGEGVTGIGERAFVGLRQLKRINLPKSVTRVDEMAFTGCVNLQEIVFSGETLEIGWGAFNDCERLKRLVLPKNITLSKCLSDARFFYDCPSLTICAPEGGTAEAFAKEQDIPFHPI